MPKKKAQPDPPPRPYAYSTENAAKALDVSLRTIWNLIEAGKLPTFKIGRKRLIRAEDIEALIERAMKGDE